MWRQESACRRQLKYSNYDEIVASTRSDLELELRQMKINIALSLIALAFLPSCNTTKTVSNTTYGTTRFANNAADQEPPPPAEGPADVNANPAYIPTPLLRSSAAASP